jgi:adenylate cyclase
MAAAVLIAAILSAATALPALDVLRGLSIDALTALRWRTYELMHDPSSSPAVVIALDEETYRTLPFAGTPNITWTREIGRVLTAAVAGGAKVVGFDVIFPTSIEQSEVPFGDDTLGGRVRGFDRDFLRDLALAARDGKVVLGEVQHSGSPILPSPGQRVAVGQQGNIRALNLYNDPDDVVRRIPLTVVTDGVTSPSMAVELAARAQGAKPELAADGTVTLSSYRIPANIPNTLTLNFEGGSDDIPTFSLADLHACIEKGDTDFFRRQFGGKVVLIGTRLDAEDRYITSKRFATAPEATHGPRCALTLPAAGATFKRDSIPGVYIHATAVNNLIRHNALTELSRLSRGLIATAIAVAVAMAALLLPLTGAVLAGVAVGAAWSVVATIAFRNAISLPLIEPIVAGFCTLAATIGYRFVIADMAQGLLRRSFAFYLAPAIIEKMMASNKLPVLGGESRNVTIYLSDLAGFSSVSEKMAPTDLVRLMNEYFAAMTDIIQEHGGFVDKYIGDAIVAVFGAPLADLNHAVNAVGAALSCHRRLGELNRSIEVFQGRHLRQRIGLNSGEVLVGNIGSPSRFNYTAMGDAVNLASRLEGANKYFGTAIIASQSTVDLARTAFLWRELDTIRVQGRTEPVHIYEPLAPSGEATPPQTEQATAYAHGLACWRIRDFAGVVSRLTGLADIDPPSALLLRRAQSFVKQPPGPSWQPINALEGK